MHPKKDINQAELDAVTKVMPNDSGMEDMLNIY
jgi:hypothetical protein